MSIPIRLLPTVPASDVPPSHPVIQVRHLEVDYRGLRALQAISLDLAPGQLIGIIGPNGAGKSTLIKAMLGLIPASGSVRYGSVPLAQQLPKVAYVPQRLQVDWTYPATVWNVVMMGRVKSTGFLRPFSHQSSHLAAQALERVGMLDFRHRPIGQLSGGQQQRVFLARALAQQAEIFTLDEPLVGVDLKTQGVIFEILHELTQAGKTVMVVHHDLSGSSILHFDQLVLLNRRLIASGSRSEVLTPALLEQAYGAMDWTPEVA